MPLNLLFHGVGTPRRKLEDGEERLWISPSHFRAVLDIAVAVDTSISVDDGNISDIEIVLPALVERGLTARFFVLAGRLDHPGSLSRSAVRELHTAGMTIGSHGMKHRPWRRLTDRQRNEEFVVAREMIASTIGSAVDEAACPRGTYERSSLADLRKQRYRHVHTSDGWPAPADAWLQPRYSISRNDDPATVEELLTAGPSLRQRLVHTAKGAFKRYR